MLEERRVDALEARAEVKVREEGEGEMKGEV